MKMKTIVRPTRRVRDVIRGNKFVALKRTPGGREVPLGKAKTRPRAVKIARYANRPNGSPTAGGTYEEGYENDVGNAGTWKFDKDDEMVIY